MVKKFIILFMAMSLFTSYSAWAQDINEIKQQIEQTAAKMQTMQCDFVQTKHLKMLDEKMVSKGKMSYQQGNKLRWEYTSPYSYIFILNENKVVIKNKYRSDEINIQQNKMFKEIVRIMMNSVVGKCLSDEKRFKVDLSVAGNEWIAGLTPQSKDMRQMFKKINIHFDKKAMMVSVVELFESNGDKTLIELKNVQQNKPLDAQTFSINN